MRKISLLTIAMVVTINVSAQFKVYSNGKVNVNCSSQMNMNDLSVGQDYHPNWYSSYNNGIYSKADIVGSSFNIGVMGNATDDFEISSGRSFGVMGIAGCSTDGYNYGVFGKILGSRKGAAIFGTSSNTMGAYVNGYYAGYFSGPVNVNGTLTATTVVTPSDLRQQENIVDLSEMDDKITLNNLLRLNVIEYNYKQTEIPETEQDTLTAEVGNNIQEKTRHFGLSVQELKEVYPNIIYEGQDGCLGVNYVELVPVLIRAIQELKGELDEIKGKGLQKNITATTSVNPILKNTNVLYQNTPNPSKESTCIHFSLADNAQNAYLYIFDMQGKMLRQIPVDSSMQNVTINGYELSAGIYLYSLVVNGQEIDTKRMIITK